LYYRALDGWSSPLFFLPPAPGGPGEPVVLAHTLGAGPDLFRYGVGPTLAQALSRAGFAVYLLTHRGDAAAIDPDDDLQPQSLQPQSQHRAFDLDDVVAHDVPAALARVCEHAGYPRVHWVGHGLGGQLGVAWAARAAGERLATLTALGAPVAFRQLPTELQVAVATLGLMPSHWRLPSRAAAQCLAPLVHPDGATAPGRVRGALAHLAADLPVGVLRQARRWLFEGTLCTRDGLYDYVEALRAVDLPILFGAGGADVVCPPEALQPLRERGEARACSELLLPASWGHHDPLLAADAPAHVYEPLTAWLSARRRLAWERDGEWFRAAS